MEAGGVCGGRRTWSSMKGHLRAQIIPRIHSFGLEEHQVASMLAASAGGLVRAERLVEVEPKRPHYKDMPVPLNDRELEEVREAQRSRKTAKATIDKKREQGRLNDIVRRERSRERKKNMKVVEEAEEAKESLTFQDFLVGLQGEQEVTSTQAILATEDKVQVHMEDMVQAALFNLEEAQEKAQ